MLLSIALKKEPIESMPRLIALVVAWLVNLNIPLFSLGWAKITEASEMLVILQVETSYLHAKVFCRLLL